MSRPFLWAVLGILALGAAAVLAVYVQSGAPAPTTVAAQPPAPAEAAAPPPAPPAAAPVAPGAPAPVPPPPPAVSAPVRAAPVAAPEYRERLESPVGGERQDALQEMREERRAKRLEWLNRRRGGRPPDPSE